MKVHHAGHEMAGSQLNDQAIAELAGLPVDEVARLRVSPAIEPDIHVTQF